MSRFGVFRIDGIDYDLDDITLDEMEKIEEYVGAPFAEMSFGSARTMKAIAFILLSRNDPTVEMADIGKIKLLDFAPPDEEAPDTGPPAEAGADSSNGSALADAGAQLSAVSTDG